MFDETSSPQSEFHNWWMTTNPWNNFFIWTFVIFSNNWNNKCPLDEHIKKRDQLGILSRTMRHQLLRNGTNTERLVSRGSKYSANVDHHNKFLSTAFQIYAQLYYILYTLPNCTWFTSISILKAKNDFVSVYFAFVSFAFASRRSWMLLLYRNFTTGYSNQGFCVHSWHPG